MSYSSSKLRSLVVASLLFGTVSVSAMASDTTISMPTLGTEINVTTSAPNEVIVTFKEGVDVFDDSNKEALSPLANMVNGYLDGFNSTFKNRLEEGLGKEKFSAKGYKNLGAMHLKSDSKSADELITLFSSEAMQEYVKHVSKNNMVTLSSSNDSYYNKLWAIENTAQEVNNKTGTDDADMDVAEAWVKTKGDQDVIVAVLDTGVDYRHDDLKDNMWSGLVKHGYDFAGDDDGTNDDDPMPDEPYDEKGHYHGTHVAGTIGAVGDNSKGVSGVAQKVSIMALKVFRPNGYGYSNDIMEALDYVAERVDAGDNIVAINASYGGGGGSQDDATNDAIKKLGEKGVVFCAAAGNEGKDIDAEPTYPASYNAENIITVAASDQDDTLASFSNFGANSVDVAAPGTNILSTFPDNRYAYLQGTSMATPNVAGTIALLASEYPNSTVAERKAMILDNVEKKSAFKGKMTTGGRVNINDALEDEPKNTAPIAENDTATTDYETSVTIDVLANDSDEDGDTLTIKSVSESSNGTVEIKDGKVIYTPKDGFSGDDSFEYIISDGDKEVSATVTVTVNKKKEDPNVAPVAKEDSATTSYETSVTIDVLANDSDKDDDKLDIISTQTPENGTVIVEAGKIIYTPNEKFEGEDSFEYTISDGEDKSTAKVVVTVEEKPNSAPVVKEDSATTSYETAVTIDVLANDSDEDGDTLIIKSVSESSNGTVEIKDGKIIYTPNEKFEGKDSFEYKVSDGALTSTSSVTVVVGEKPNSAPVAKDDTATANYNESVTIEVLKNDSDEDGDTLTIDSFTEATNGTVSKEGENLVYTPKSDYSGEDEFTYTITDGEAQVTATVKIKVKEKSERIKLPIFDGGFGMGQSSDEWKEVDFSNHDIGFSTKKGNEVTMGLDKDNQLVGSVKVNGKESKLTINIPDASVKIDSDGATLIEFKGKEMSIVIGADGTIAPKLPALKDAVLPKDALPLGTELTVSGDLMKFVLPLSKEIKF
jgi:subtilisin family serine protease